MKRINQNIHRQYSLTIIEVNFNSNPDENHTPGTSVGISLGASGSVIFGGSYSEFFGIEYFDDKSGSDF